MNRQTERRNQIQTDRQNDKKTSNDVRRKKTIYNISTVKQKQANKNRNRQKDKQASKKMKI